MYVYIYIYIYKTYSRRPVRRAWAEAPAARPLFSLLSSLFSLFSPLSLPICISPYPLLCLTNLL